MTVNQLKWNVFFVAVTTLFACNSDQPKEATEAVEQQVEIPTKQKTIEINGVEHFFTIKGNSEGEPIIFLHGGPGLSHNYLLPYFDELAANYQLIFYDQRGSGKSAFPKDTTSINIATFVEDIEGIRKYFDKDKIILAGHSWGSLLALHYGQKYPDNLTQLILISPAPTTSTHYEKMLSNMQQKRKEEDTKELVKLMMSKEFEKRDPETFTNAMKIGDKANLYDQTKVDELYKLHSYNEKTASNFWMVSNIMEKNFFNYDITSKINNINCPSIIIIGDMDNVPFASNQLLSETLNNTKLEVIKETGHYPFFEDPKVFNNALNNFLNPEYQD
jgi:proline iminopeptidase|tara:strand:- start:78840 stop:79832 length:993 start_codon:yes stop_codon:yes gene_type:complete